MVKAYVLIVTEPGATRRLVETIRDLDLVHEVHEVMGPYDIVIEISVPSLVDVPPILSTQIRAIDGIQSTTSLCLAGHSVATSWKRAAAATTGA